MECGVGNAAGVIVMVVGGAGRVDTGLIGGSLCGLHKRLTFLNLRNKTKRKVLKKASFLGFPHFSLRELVAAT